MEIGIRIKYLDTVKQDVLVGWSTRKLFRDYRGYCMQVRRDYDYKKLNVGFNGQNILDWNAIEQFSKGSDVYVSKWYDQTGYNNHAIQPITSNQPLIADKGVICRIKRRPAIYSGGQHYTYLFVPVLSENYSRIKVTSSFSYYYIYKIMGWGIDNPYNLSSIFYMSSSALDGSFINTCYGSTVGDDTFNKGMAKMTINKHTMASPGNTVKMYQPMFSGGAYYDEAPARQMMLYNSGRFTTYQYHVEPIDIYDYPLFLLNRADHDRVLNGYCSELVLFEGNQMPYMTQFYASQKQELGLT